MDQPLYRQDPTGRFRDRAADYAAARPSYPAAALDALLEDLGAPAALVVADVGAGTGIAARLVAERGARVLAVEPNAAMRAAAEPHPRVSWHDGSAGRTGLATHAVHLVLCAQAFHWFEPGRALPELTRILKPGGRLAVMWNEREREQDPTTAAYSRLVNAASGDHPADRAYDDPRPVLAAGRFDVTDARAFANAQRLTREGLLARARSASYVPKEGAEADRLLEALDLLHAELADREGFVTLRYATRLVRARPPA